MHFVQTKKKRIIILNQVEAVTGIVIFNMAAVSSLVVLDSGIHTVEASFTTVLLQRLGCWSGAGLT